MVVVAHIATKLVAELAHGGKRPTVNQVAFEGVKERLHVSALAGGTAARHTLLNASGGQGRPKRRARKLAPTIAVKDRAGRRAATASLNHGARQPRVSSVAESPPQGYASTGPRPPPGTTIDRRPRDTSDRRPRSGWGGSPESATHDWDACRTSDACPPWADTRAHPHPGRAHSRSTLAGRWRHAWNRPA
jgi:hypothetical protein